jgi:hypothetical protein
MGTLAFSSADLGTMNEVLDDRVTSDDDRVHDADTAANPLLPAAMADTLSELIDAVGRANRLISAMTALRAELIDQARMWSELSDQANESPDPDHRGIARRALRAELACELRLPERTIENLLGMSEALVHDFRATFDALLAGEITYRHAQILIDNMVTLDEAAAVELELPALRYARSLSASKFERKVRSLRERHHPESITERHQKAVDDREVSYSAGRDGMAWLSAYLPAPDALGIYNRVTDIAISLQAPEESRTLTQLRADALRDLILDDYPAISDSSGISGVSDSSDGSATGHRNIDHRDTDTTGSDTGHPSRARFRGIRPRVLITVPVLTLLGHSDEPATLDGYGPIDPETARELAGRAPSFIRLLTHPETGTVLSVGRTKYRVPEDLRTWLRVRDGTCRFPGCSRNARHCDIDHTVDWAFGGGTRHDNLAHLCPSHHSLKHASRWEVVHARDGTGTLNWTSPTGRHYATEPDTWMGATGISVVQNAPVGAQPSTPADDPPPF